DNGQGMACSTVASRTKVKVFGTPIADAGENLVCCQGKEAKFDASKSQAPEGSTLTYHWDFGDGGTADTAQATHTYEKVGSYRVVLTVKDNTGSECGTSTSSFVATVNGQPEAVIRVK